MISITLNLMLLTIQPRWRQAWRKLAAAEPKLRPAPSRYNVEVWEDELKDFPDRDISDWLTTGLAEGFRIGHTGERPHGRARNLPTTDFEKLEIVNWLTKGYEEGYILGPFEPDAVPFDGVTISPVGAVPKPPDKCRMIHHLSAPKDNSGLSVNDVIEESMKEVQYVTIQEIVEIADSVGVGGYIWTVDAKDAYVRVPVHEKEWPLLGIKFQGKVFVMTCLPFGLASSCKIYNQFADVVEWIVVRAGGSDFTGFTLEGKPIQLMRHYLDDFMGGHKKKKIAFAQFNLLVRYFSYLQIPTQPKKCSEPATIQKVLGSLLDTVRRLLILPEDKCTRYAKDLVRVLELDKKGKKIRKDVLQSLAGKLRFAARHVWCGANFCRRLEWKFNQLKHDSHRTRLTKIVREDLEWWLEILDELKTGLSFDYILRPRNMCSWTIWTDACVDEESAGFGGLNSEGRWFQFKIPMTHFKKRRPKINWCELAAQTVALRLWAREHRHQSVKLWCDNMAAVQQLKKQSTGSDHPDIFALIRRACKESIKHRYHYWIDHIKGENNDPADALSRFYEDPFEGVERLQPGLREKMTETPDECEKLFLCLFEEFEQFKL